MMPPEASLSAGAIFELLAARTHLKDHHRITYESFTEVIDVQVGPCVFGFWEDDGYACHVKKPYNDGSAVFFLSDIPTMPKLTMNIFGEVREIPDVSTSLASWIVVWIQTVCYLTPVNA